MKDRHMVDEAAAEVVQSLREWRDDAKAGKTLPVGQEELSARDYDNRMMQMRPDQVKAAYAKDPRAVMDSLGRILKRRNGQGQ